jgi:TRAP-type C4-dicarboxylate transport system permease small subunit
VQRLLAWTDKLVVITGNLFLAGFLTIVVVQVFARYVLHYALPWTEELGVYLFVWASFMAASVVVGMNDHFSISFFAEQLTGRRRGALDVIVTLLCILFALIMVLKGAGWSWRMLPTSSSVLQVPQGAVYVILPLSGLYMLAHLAVRFARLLSGEGETGDEVSRPKADDVRL